MNEYDDALTALLLLALPANVRLVAIPLVRFVMHLLTARRANRE